MHACPLISLASFIICMILCFILTCCAPSLICFKGSPREKWALLFRVSTRKNMKKPNLSLTRPYPLTRVKRRDFWSLPSDFPITHPNPIWKQWVGVTWCCLNLISNYSVLSTTIFQHQVNPLHCCAPFVRRLSMLGRFQSLSKRIYLSVLSYQSYVISVGSHF